MILMNDFRAEPADLRAAMFAAMGRVLDSGWYVLGPECAAFEQRWADACGVAHAVGVGNGMDALEVGLRAMRIGPGDEVITTPMTAFATVLAILRAGAAPVLADIDPDTALLSLASVRRCLSSRTRAVLLVHLYGRMPAMAPWQAFCDEAGIALIEDCAQAHGARVDGRAAGAFGRFAAFSFYPTKNLGTAGDGGALVTDDDALAESARQLRNYGQSERYLHPQLGLNSRLDELHAAMLGARLAWLPRFTAQRREIAARYRQAIDNASVRLLAAPGQPGAHVHHLFVLCCPARDLLQAHLHERGVQSLIHYPVPVHHQPPAAHLARDPAGLAASEAHAASCLSLPCHPQLSDCDVERVIAAVNDFRAPGA